MLLFQSLVFGLMLYLSLFIPLILSLAINNPPHIVSDGNSASVNIEWLESAGDPPSIDIQILCGAVAILQPPISAKTSVHGLFINNNFAWNANTFKGTCIVQAYNGGTLLKEGPPFSAPQLSRTEPHPHPNPPLPPNPPPPPNPPLPPNPPPPPNRPTTTSLSSKPIPSPTSSHTNAPEDSNPVGSLTPSTKVTSTSTTQTPTTDLTSLTAVLSSTPSSGIVPPTIFTPSTALEKTNSRITTNTPSPAIPISTSISPVSSDGNGSHKSNLAAILGGVFAGIVFLVLFLVLLRFCLRRRRLKKTVEWEKNLQPIDRKYESKVSSTIPSFLPRSFLSPTPDLPTFDQCIQLEDELERLNRVQEEMREARIQRDLVRSNLESHTGILHSQTEETLENDLSETETEMERELRQQYDRLSALVFELEAQLREVELPPDYNSSGHA